MYIVTHALIPALIATPFLWRETRPEFYRKAGIIALGGVLPDLLHPHLSLAARYASWSHSVFAAAGIGLLLLAAHWRWPQRFTWLVVIAAWTGFALHLFTDAVSGGIAPLQPVSNMIVRPETRWIPYRWWWWSDALFSVVAVLTILLRREPPRQRAAADSSPKG